MTAFEATWLMLGLLTKHFILDWLYQPAYQWQNKGTYGHWGGLIHAGQHSVGTAFALAKLSPATAPVITFICFAEFFLHYHIDWAKMNINRIMGWKCNTHNEFWYLTGLDGYLHHVTYVGIVIAVLANVP